MSAKIAIFAGLVAVLLLSGCSTELRMHCQSLSTVQQSSVPECASAKECEKKLAESLDANYGFGEAFLDWEIERWADNVSLSWLYYNKAGKSMKELQQACYAGSEGIVQKANELEFNFSKAMDYMDLSVKSEFSAMLLQEARLRREKIGLAREEALYADFAELNEILNDGENSESAFAKKHAQAKAILEGMGERQSAIEVSERDLLDEALPEMLKQIRQAGIVVELGKQAAKSISKELRMQDDLGKASGILARINAGKVAESFESYNGTKASLAFEFARLFKRIKQDEQSLQSESAAAIEDAEKTIEEVKEQIEQASGEDYSGAGFGLLQKLMQEFGIEEGMNAKEGEFSTIAEFQASAMARAEGIDEMIEDAKTGKTIGERASGAKIALKKAKELEKETGEYCGESIEKLKAACAQKAEEILKKIEGLEKESEGFFELRVLEEKAKAAGKGRFEECGEMLEALENARLKAEDSAGYSALAGKESGQCMEEMGNAMENYKIGGIYERFALLEEAAKYWQSPEKTREECESIRKDYIKEARQLSQETEKLWAELAGEKEIAAEKQGAAGKKAEETAKSLAKYFLEGNAESISKRLALKEEIEQSIQSAIDGLREQRKESAIRQIRESVQISAGIEGIIEAGKSAKIKCRIVVESPMAIMEKFSINLGKKACAEIRGENYWTESDSNSTMLWLNGIEKGILEIGFECEGIAAEITQESTKCIFASEEKALFERKITLKLNAAGYAGAVLVSTEIPESAKARALSEEKEIQISRNGRNAELLVESAQDLQEITLLFEIASPMQKQARLAEESQEYGKDYKTFEVIAENKSGMQLENARILLEFAEGAESIIAEEESGKEAKTGKGIYGLAITGQSLGAGETKKYFVRTVFEKDLFDWQAIMQESEALLKEIAESTGIDSIRDRAMELLEENELLMQEFSGKNKQEKDKALKISQNARELEAEQKSKEASQKTAGGGTAGAGTAGKSEGSAEALEKIKKAESIVKELKKAGFDTASLEKEIFAGRQTAEALLAKAGIEEAGQEAERILEIAGREKEKAIIKAREEIKTIAERILEFAKNSESAGAAAERIVKKMQGFGQKEFSEMMYVPPITLQEAERAGIEIQAMKAQEAKEGIGEIMLLSDSNQALEALPEARELIAKNEKNWKRAAELSEKLEAAEKKLEKDSQEIVAGAKEAGKNSANKKVEFLLEKASAELENKMPLKAMQYASYATALAGMGEGFTMPELPIALIPLIAIVGTAVFVRQKREKTEKERKEKIMKIARKAQE